MGPSIPGIIAWFKHYALALNSIEYRGGGDLIIWVDIVEEESGEWLKGCCSQVCDNTSLFGNGYSVFVIN